MPLSNGRDNCSQREAFFSASWLYSLYFFPSATINRKEGQESESERTEDPIFASSFKKREVKLWLGKECTNQQFEVAYRKLAFAPFGRSRDNKRLKKEERTRLVGNLVPCNFAN